MVKTVGSGVRWPEFRYQLCHSTEQITFSLVLVRFSKQILTQRLAYGICARESPWYRQLWRGRKQEWAEGRVGL